MNISNAFLIILDVAMFQEGLSGGFCKNKNRYLTNLCQTPGVQQEFQTAFSGVLLNTTSYGNRQGDHLNRACFCYNC